MELSLSSSMLITLSVLKNEAEKVIANSNDPIMVGFHTKQIIHRIEHTIEYIKQNGNYTALEHVLMEHGCPDMMKKGED